MKVDLGLPGQIMPPARIAVANAQRGEEQGFASMWWPSHLMGWHPDSLWTPDMTPLATSQPNPHQYFDPFAMMAAVAAATDRIRLGVVVADLITRNPAIVAQTALTLDHLSEGRLILGLGSGERMNIEPYGLPFNQPVARLAEGIEVIRLLWRATGPVDFDGRFNRLESAVLGLAPFDREPEIWIAAHGPRMLDLAGRLGDGWLPTKIPPDQYRASLDVIHRARQEVGRDSEEFTPGMLGYVLLAPDEATLEHLLAQPLVRYLCIMLPPETFEALGTTPPLQGGGFHGILPSSLPREEALRIVAAIPPRIVQSYAFCGTPEQVAEQIADYHRAGLRHLICWNITPFGDPSLAGWSFRALRELHELTASG
jgi:phthiodiolone/phenolphthiodiolone dimycocerosates ketoreductase